MVGDNGGPAVISPRRRGQTTLTAGQRPDTPDIARTRRGAPDSAADRSAAGRPSGSHGKRDGATGS